ncbi:uncharacterized protein LOC133863122 [Alnus glutinosa]|uniref:uncharacterized protein LOC133863122 n=1 Tax=Alnus glutinosa TaxID=3517 RepID=UPI002D773DB8|nr:uncharacterized protein LOC133863122 [Alnus glutinosa]
MERFRSVLDAFNLGDLRYRGSKYTWSNKRSSPDFIKARLDRALVNPGWCSRHPDVLVEVLAARSSDHKPLWIQFSARHKAKQGPRTFKYKACWNLDSECKEVVQAEWMKGTAGMSALGATMAKLDWCKQALYSKNPNNLEETQEVQEEIDHLLEMEDVQ